MTTARRRLQPPSTAPQSEQPDRALLGSTSTWAPWGMRVVAPCAPITAAMPNSRATIAAWHSGPPSSTTRAPITGSSEFTYGPVNGATSTSPGSSWSKASIRSRTTHARPR